MNKLKRRTAPPPLLKECYQLSVRYSISNLDHAINYAKLGLSVLPLCWSDENGQCACGQGHQGKEVGKAPLIHGGHLSASSDIDQVREWWERWPNANIGVSLAKSNLLVIDCDSPDAIREIKELGIPPGVAISKTGGRGAHFFFHNSAGILRRRTKWGKSGDIDLLSDGYVVLPPSKHASGRLYQWQKPPGNGDLPSPPPWVIEAMEEDTSDQEVADEPVPHDVEERAQRVLQQVAPRWRRLYEEVAGDRSERSAALARAAVEAGVTDLIDIASFVYLSASHQDKFRERRDGWKDALRCAKKTLESYSSKANERPCVQIINARELMDLHLPEPKWAIPGLIPQGVTLLAGRPKIGKSWLALQIAVAVATGSKALGSIDVEAGSVLYLALEDTHRRLQSRLEKLQGARVKRLNSHTFDIYWGDFDPPDRLGFAIAWPRFDNGGLDALEDWLSHHTDARLIVIDTLAKVRPVEKANGNVYSEDYRAIEGLKSLVDRHNVAALVIHHLRKTVSTDPLEMISGSTGLTGAVDATLVLKRERTRADAELYITGRDVEEKELALEWDRQTAKWTILGPAEEYRQSSLRTNILNALRNAGVPLRPSEVAEIMNRNPSTVRTVMWKMANEGHLVANGDGSYSLTH